MEFRISHPNFNALAAAGALFVMQFTLFFGGEYVLYLQSLDVLLGLNEEAWEFIWPPHGLLELGLFLATTAVVALFYCAIARLKCIRVRCTRLALCFLIEIALFITLNIVSAIGGSRCTMLLTMPMPYFPLSICGTSSVNPVNFWFALFALLTVAAWSGMLSDGRRALLRISINA